MDVLIFCILCFLLQNLTLAEQSNSDEKDNSYEKLENLSGQRTKLIPYFNSDECLSSSYDIIDYSANFYDMTSPSTSRDTQYSIPCNELAVCSSDEKRADELKQKKNNQCAINFCCTNNTSSTDLNISMDTDLIKALEEVSSYYLEQCESSNFLDTSKNILDDILETSEEDISKDVNNTLIHSILNLDTYMYTSSDVVEVIKNNMIESYTNELMHQVQNLNQPMFNTNTFLKDTKKDILESNVNRPTYVQDDTVSLLCTLIKKKGRSTEVENISDNNEEGDNDVIGYDACYSGFPLKRHRQDIIKIVILLKQIQKVMVQCPAVDKEQCFIGLSELLRIPRFLEQKLSFDFREYTNEFFKHIENVQKSVSSYDFSKELTSVDDFLKSMPMYMLSLFLMYMAPVHYSNMNHNKKAYALKKKQILGINTDEFIKNFDANRFTAQCNKLKWSKLSHSRIPDISIFAYVLFLKKEFPQPNILESIAVNWYEKVTWLRRKYFNIVQFWVQKNISHYNDVCIILNKLNDFKLETEELLAALEQLMNTICERITSRFNSLQDFIIFWVYWSGVLLMGCMNSMHYTFAAPLLGFFIYEKFLGDCEKVVSFEVIVKHDNVSFLNTNIDMLMCFFAYLYLRSIHLIVYTIVKSLGTMCNLLKELETQSGSCLNRKKKIILQRISLKDCETSHHQINILKKINMKRKKLQNIRRLKKLINKINSNIDNLKKLCYIKRSDGFEESVISGRLSDIKNDYSRLFKLLSIESNDLFDEK